MTTERSIRAIAGGDRAAFEALYRARYTAMARYAAALLGGDRAGGEDAADEAFLDLWRNAGQTPFGNMRMAEMAAYSIVWAMYAAALVAIGFALRNRLFRLIGLVAFGPILFKVFFLDLAHLELLPRVLALAVVGMALLGVSFLYQKFAARLGGA